MRKPSYLLDSNVVIRHLRSEPDTLLLVRSLGKQEYLAIASITRLEIRVGLQEAEEYKTQKLLSRFVTYEMDTDIAERAGDYIRLYRQRGMSLSVPDAIIAATAIHHGLTLVTYNPKDFRLPGLSLYPVVVG